MGLTGQATMTASLSPSTPSDAATATVSDRLRLNRVSTGRRRRRGVGVRPADILDPAGPYSGTAGGDCLNAWENEGGSVGEPSRPATA